jgi:vitamin B12 transporter
MKNCFKPSALTLAILSACVASSSAVYAQTSSATPSTKSTPSAVSELPTVVVTANRMPQTVADTIASTTLISRDDIERSVAADLPALLVSQAGIELGRNGGQGQLASLFMRGTNPSETLVLIDGVAINDQNFGNANLSLIPLSTIERIEIVRGNVSAAYGSNAFGGVVQIFTKQASGNKPFTAEANTSIGTQGQRAIGANVGFGNTDTRVMLAASRTTTKGISATRMDQSPSDNPDKDGSAQTTGSIGINHRASSTLNLGLQVLSTSQNTEYDANYLVGDDVRAHARSSQVSGFADWRVMPSWLLQAKISEHSESNQNTVDGMTDSESADRRQLLSVQNTIELGQLGTAFVGVEHEGARFSSTASWGKTPETTRSINALLAGWQGKANGFGWSANLRQDRGAGENIGTYAIGGSYDITPEFSLRASQATAFNRPTLSAASTNANLKSKRANTQELGVQWQQGTSLVRITGFRNKVTNQLDYDAATKQYFNIFRTSNQGLEILGEMAMPWSGGKLRAGFTSHNPINDTTGTVLNRRAKQQLHLGLAGVLGAYIWDTTANYIGARQDTIYNDWPTPNTPVTLKSYVKLDVNVGYDINKQAKVSVGLSNITNATDQSAYGYSGTPRGAVVRFNYAFK